jgi:hypothetical protein
LLLVGLSMGIDVYAEQSAAGGVIVAEQVAVSSGPGTQYATELSLHAQRVDVQGELGAPVTIWRRVGGLGAGRGGRVGG